MDGWTRRIEICALIAAAALLLANINHIAVAGLWSHWWSPVVVVLATLAADLVSGVVHWTADTPVQRDDACARTAIPSSFSCSPRKP